MGRNEKEGVENSYGEVHGYPDLYVADGSVMPGPSPPLRTALPSTSLPTRRYEIGRTAMDDDIIFEPLGF